MVALKSFIRKQRKLVLVFYKVLFWFESFGVQLLRTKSAIQGVPFVVKDYFQIKKQNKLARKQWKLGFTMPCFHDKYDFGGVASGDYFHQDLLVAQKIFKAQPRIHADVGSRIDGFVAHVAAFRTIEVFDIRPLNAHPKNIVFKQADFMELPDHLREYCDSLSCLHALEHFGLGRYGDPIDVDGYRKGFENLCKMLKPNGTLYFSVPIGVERIEFNAHRVFSIETILALANGRLGLIDFSYVDDRGDLHESPLLDEEAVANSFNLHYGCGIFEFRKLS
jgi:SAM-dependent methyltransferase